MASLIPETALRLQAVAFVSDAELNAVGRVPIIRLAAEKLAEQGLRKLLSDCIKTEGDYMGYMGQTLRLDVYVLSPWELHKIIADALRQGANDTARWMGPNALGQATDAALSRQVACTDELAAVSPEPTFNEARRNEKDSR